MLYGFPRFSCPEICNKCSYMAISISVQNNNKCCCTDFDFCAKRTTETCCTDFASIFVKKDSHLLYGLPRNSCQIEQLPVASKTEPNYCMASWKSCQKAVVRSSRKSCQKLPWNVCQTLLYGLAETLPWNVCQAAASFSSLPRNLPCSLALLLSICS